MAKGTFVDNPQSTDGFIAGDMAANFNANNQGDWAPLRPRAQSTPDLTIQVATSTVESFFRQVQFDATPITFAGGNTAAMSAPGANPRIDLIALRLSDESLQITTGAEAASPTVPAVPSGQVPICEIFHRVGTVKILDFEDDDSTNSFIQRDRRPFLQSFDKDILDALDAAAAPTAANPFATAADIPGGGATFQWEAKRTTGLTAGVFTTVAFTSSFTEPPVIVVTSEDGSVSEVTIRNVTKDDFDLRVETNGTVCHWFACSAGLWLVNSNLVYAGWHAEFTAAGDFLPKQFLTFPRPFAAAPFVGGSLSQADQKTGISTDKVKCDRISPSRVDLISTGTDRDIAATHGVNVRSDSSNQGLLGIIAIQQTGAATNADDPTSAGTGSFKGGHKFESGLNIATSNPGPALSTISFSAAFGAAPVGIALVYEPIGGAGTTDQSQLNAQPGTGSMVVRHLGISAGRVGDFWMAMDEGDDTATATRLI